jgi:molybdopterin/thiamine biosynthesis adenylyltransferase
MIKPIKVTNINEFLQKNPLCEIVDQYHEMLEELFQIRNPQAKFSEVYKSEFEDFKKSYLKNEDIKNSGVWFFYPWNKILVHFLEDELHQEIRTARNKNLISHIEQGKLLNSTVAIAGLSVGSHAALILSMMGIARNIKLADSDNISASNLNRLQYDFTKIGKNKAEVVAEYIYQRNPYSNIDIFNNGVTDDSIDKFLEGVDVLIEEMDNLPMKIKIRKRARELGIPVIMATDNGSSVILDIERFDIDKNYPIFHGRIKSLDEISFEKSRHDNPKEWNKIASEIIGIEFMESDLISSLKHVGKTLGGIPQLGLAATMSGTLLVHALIKIITNKSLVSGKFLFSIDSILTPEYNSDAQIKLREEIRADFRKFLES